MGQTRMFRDRVVSMEQTLEGGEKHLPLLKAICGEALPDLAFREHSLDHERDLFVMDFDAPDGTRRRIGWTRMVLFDAERIPTLTSDPAAALRAKIVELLRAQAGKPEILVTFRHLEEGWVDTPEPRREGGRRRRRGGRGGRGGERAGPRPSAPPRDRERRPGGRPPAGGARASQPPSAAPGARSGGPDRRPPAAAPAPAGGAAPGGAGKRRRRRRRRGRGPGAGSPGPGGAPPSPGPRP